MRKPVNCRYFYGDYHRGANREECRLIAANPNSPYPWRRKLCDSCPVPEIVITSSTRELLLEAEVQRKFLWSDQVEITFAVCQRHMRQLEDPRNCPDCAAEQEAKETGGGK